MLKHKTEECVAVYKSNVPPDEFIGVAFNLGKWYNWALMAIESNKDGLWVNDGLDKMGYINLYYRKVFDDITKNVTKFFGWNEVWIASGWLLLTGIGVSTLASLITLRRYLKV